MLMQQQHLQTSHGRQNKSMDWRRRELLLFVQSGTLLSDLESPMSLGLTDGAMLVAVPADQRYARSS